MNKAQKKTITLFSFILAGACFLGMIVKEVYEILDIFEDIRLYIIVILIFIGVFFIKGDKHE